MALLLVVICQPSPAPAWSEAGHKIIVSIAFRKLPRPRRTDWPRS